MYAMSINAQDSIAGEYYLHGVMETTSGFQLNADSTFQFFFSYGALDRSGKGKWSLKDDSTIIFNSKKRPPLDFKLEKHEQRKDDFITVQITDNNTNLLRYVAGFIKTKTGGEEFEMSSDGVAQIKIQPIDSIALIFTICPDRYSLFPVADKNDNYFSFQFEQWITDVFFENFTLNFKNNILTGKHPLLEGNNFSYEKD
jgi:hypothetical protein